MTAIPSPLARSIRRSVDSRTWPTLPAGPSSSSTVAVWIEVDDDQPRPLGPRGLDDPPDVVLGEDPHALRRTDPSAGRGAPPAAGPGRAIPRRSRTGRSRRPAPGVRPAAAWRRSVDLPIPGSPPRRTSDPGHEPAAEDPVELADPEAQPRQVRVGDAGRDATATSRRPRRRRRPRARERARLADDGLDQACSSRRTRGIGPPSGGTTSPQDWQTKRLCGRAIARPPVGRRGSPRLDRGARLLGEVGCRGPPRGPCPRRSSSRARTCRAGGARRGRPRSCSG